MFATQVEQKPFLVVADPVHRDLVQVAVDAGVWAEEPTRDTERPTFTAGRTPWKNRSVSRKIWPSVIEITLVGMKAETSLPWVSMTGSAVSEPDPLASFSFAERSSRRECR